MKKLGCLIFVLIILSVSYSNTQELSEPERNFERLWQIFDKNYGIFLPKRVDWDLLYKVYRPKVTPETTEDDLREAFAAFGQVESVTLIKDKFTGESRGFGFVEMPSKDEAQKAIDEMNGTDLKGRALNVNEARPKTDRRGGRGGGGGGGRLDGYPRWPDGQE